MMNSRAMFSSKKNEWSTPIELFDELNCEFHFDLDPCSTDKNHLCQKYYTKEQDGLKQKWGGRVFCNPPYGKEIGKWVRKAWQSTRQEDGTVVVMLIPARTDTKYFQQYIYNRAEIRFINGRLKFGGVSTSAPFPSMLVIFRSPNGRKGIMK